MKRTLVNRARNKKGEFTNSSPYSKKHLSVRLLKEDDKTLKDLAVKKNITPTELARIAIAEWLKQQEETA